MNIIFLFSTPEWSWKYVKENISIFAVNRCNPNLKEPGTETDLYS